MFVNHFKNQVTYNPNPDPETYLSAGFRLFDSEESEVISVIQNKRTVVPHPTTGKGYLNMAEVKIHPYKKNVMELPG